VQTEKCGYLKDDASLCVSWTGSRIQQKQCDYAGFAEAATRKLVSASALLPLSCKGGL